MSLPPSQPALVARDLACRRGGRLVFAGLSLRLEPGAALIVTGPNGAGKSSLLRLAAGLGRPAAGRIGWEPADEEEAGGRAAYLGHADALKPTLSALENVRFWAAMTDRRAAESRAEEALEAFGVAHLAALPGRLLSSGQKRRVGLAGIMANPARLWLLDEPLVGLDEDGQRRLAAVLTAHRARGGIVIAATHQPLGLAEVSHLRMGRPARAGAAA